MRDAFATIYDQDLWSQGSGPGSTLQATEDYRSFVEQFIQERRIGRILDLGCGDWTFSQRIDWQGAYYCGIDVVPRVIAENRRGFQSECVRFEEADFSQMELPPAELVLIKDVLQHWTNEEVLAFLPKLRSYPYVVVTNDLGVLREGRLDSTGLNGVFTGDPRWQWRPLDLTLEPFHLRPAQLLTYDAADTWRKHVLVLEGGRRGFKRKRSP